MSEKSNLNWGEIEMVIFLKEWGISDNTICRDGVALIKNQKKRGYFADVCGSQY